MDQSQVTLQIPMEWWIWRGLHPFLGVERPWIGGLEFQPFGADAFVWDPMEAQDFDVTRAFPLFKPAIDVFGVPRRSRKQRGWYQVRSPWKPTPTCRTLSTLASAADIPPELISMIVLEIGGVDELASCARVCHHWARVLQPRLFEHITLCSRDDMQHLLDIHRTSLTNLSQAIESLTLMTSFGAAPFAHRIAKIKHTFRADLTIDGPSPPSACRNLRSIHASLPRSLPPAASRGITFLELRDVHFRSFMDLVELVSELPHLDSFTGSRLTWTEESAWPHISRRHTAAKRDIGRRHSWFTLINSMPGHRWVVLSLTGLQGSSEEFSALLRQIEERLAHVEACSAVCNVNRNDLSES